MIWNDNYHKANVLNRGKGHCLYFVLYQAMNDIDGNNITVNMANSVRKLLRQHLSEQLMVACIRNITVANSISGEFYSAFYETPTLQQLRIDHAEDLEARFSRTPLSNILNEVNLLLDHGAATFDEFMPVPVKVYWIELWHKLMKYVDYWGGAHDIMLASLVYDMDIIVWQHCSNKEGLDSDPDPTCDAIYRPTYPHRYNSPYRCEINIIQYPE
jgi:hypothetical protein